MKFIGVIPARYASTRFPGKPLAIIGDKPMIQWVYERSCKALDHVVVATDDERIFNCVKHFGGEVVMTSSNHSTGTDRIAEAVRLLSTEADVVINIQGDEPFVDLQQIEALKRCFDNPTVDIATLVRPFPAESTFEQLDNPNTPKVVTKPNGEAMMFSRSVIPYLRGVDKNQWANHHRYYAHIGIYAYKRTVLQQITTLERTPLEIAESLEQLRWLEHGYHIMTAITNTITQGIDTPDDLCRANQQLKSLK